MLITASLQQLLRQHRRPAGAGVFRSPSYKDSRDTCLQIWTKRYNLYMWCNATNIQFVVYGIPDKFNHLALTKSFHMHKKSWARAFVSEQGLPKFHLHSTVWIVICFENNYFHPKVKYSQPGLIFWPTKSWPIEIQFFKNTFWDFKERHNEHR